MENKVLKEEEINKIQELRTQFSNLANVVGSIEIQIIGLEIEKENIKNNLKQLQSQAQVLAKELEEKYGKGSVSLETKEFIPTP